MARTVTSVHGTLAADRLAALAIDLLCDAPEARTGRTPTARISWRLIEEGRAALDEIGIDWRYLVRDRVARARS